MRRMQFLRRTTEVALEEPETEVKPAEAPETAQAETTPSEEAAQETTEVTTAESEK